MSIYLRFINPIVSVLVLFFCLWAATVDKGSFHSIDTSSDPIQVYFLAKGLFCSSALFILGKILENMLNKKKNT